MENAGVPVLQEQLAVMREKKKHHRSIICRQWTVGDLVTLTIGRARLIYGRASNGKGIKIDLL